MPEKQKQQLSEYGRSDYQKRLSTAQSHEDLPPYDNTAVLEYGFGYVHSVGNRLPERIWDATHNSADRDIAAANMMRVKHLMARSVIEAEMRQLGEPGVFNIKAKRQLEGLRRQLEEVPSPDAIENDFYDSQTVHDALHEQALSDARRAGKVIVTSETPAASKPVERATGVDDQRTFGRWHDARVIEGFHDDAAKDVAEFPHSQALRESSEFYGRLEQLMSPLETLDDANKWLASTIDQLGVERNRYREGIDALGDGFRQLQTGVWLEQRSNDRGRISIVSEEGLALLAQGIEVNSRGQKSITLVINPGDALSPKIVLWGINNNESGSIRVGYGIEFLMPGELGGYSNSQICISAHEKDNLPAELRVKSRSIGGDVQQRDVPEGKKGWDDATRQFLELANMAKNTLGEKMLAAEMDASRGDKTTHEGSAYAVDLERLAATIDSDLAVTFYDDLQRLGVPLNADDIAERMDAASVYEDRYVLWRHGMTSSEETLLERLKHEDPGAYDYHIEIARSREAAASREKTSV